MSDLPGGGSTQSDGVQSTLPQAAQIGEIIPYALIALASFLCGIGVLGLNDLEARSSVRSEGWRILTAIMKKGFI